jgi:hypothetical protein
MTHFLLLLLSAIILGDVISIDPIEGIVRDFAYAVRKTIQQVIILGVKKISERFQCMKTFGYFFNRPVSVSFNLYFKGCKSVSSANTARFVVSIRY